MGVFFGFFAVELRMCGGCWMSWNVEVEIKDIYMYFLSGFSIRRGTVNKMKYGCYTELSYVLMSMLNEEVTRIWKFNTQKNITQPNVGGGRSPPDHSAQSGGDDPPHKKLWGDASPPSPMLVTPMYNCSTFFGMRMFHPRASFPPGNSPSIWQEAPSWIISPLPLEGFPTREFPTKDNFP